MRTCFSKSYYISARLWLSSVCNACSSITLCLSSVRHRRRTITDRGECHRNNIQFFLSTAKVALKHIFQEIYIVSQTKRLESLQLEAFIRPSQRCQMSPYFRLSFKFKNYTSSMKNADTRLLIFGTNIISPFRFMYTYMPYWGRTIWVVQMEVQF